MLEVLKLKSPTTTADFLQCLNQQLPTILNKGNLMKEKINLTLMDYDSLHNFLFKFHETKLQISYVNKWKNLRVLI